MHFGVEAGGALRPALAGWAALDPAVDASLTGLVVVDSFDRPAAASLDLGRVLGNEALVVELVPLPQPLWRSIVGVGESGALPRTIGSRGVEWRSLGLESVEHWRCRSPQDLAVTVGTFVGVGGRRRRAP